MNIAGLITTAGATLASALRRVYLLPQQPTVAEQRAEAARVVEAAAQREAKDEVIRTTSRRVMNEMWPSRRAAVPAARVDVPATTSTAASAASAGERAE
jgi:hypothetical protein